VGRRSEDELLRLGHDFQARHLIDRGEGGREEEGGREGEREGTRVCGKKIGGRAPSAGS